MRAGMVLATGVLGAAGGLLGAAGGLAPVAGTPAGTVTVLRFREPSPSASTPVLTPSFTIATDTTWKAYFAIRCAGSGHTAAAFAAEAERGGQRLFAIRPPVARNLDYVERVSGYTGTFRLQVTSPCPWSVTVVASSAGHPPAHA